MMIRLDQGASGMILGLALILLLGACGDDLVDPRSSVFYQSVSAGGEHSCAVDEGGNAYCWGLGRSGQIGDQGNRNRSRPAQVDPIRRWASISAGGKHSCAVTEEGEALCWGWNAFGQLGLGERVGLGSPGTVAGGHTWKVVSSGRYHTCGLTTSGTAYCWGHNRQGQLGDGSRTDEVLAPVEVAGGIEFATISAGAQHTCAIGVDGKAYCWGLNQYGQLGESKELYELEPVLAWPDHQFSTISAGVGHTCALTTQGEAYCWGKNEAGELGNGSIDEIGLHRIGPPVKVHGGHRYQTIDAGDAVTCAVATNGRAYCWGEGVYGQLGLGSTIGHPTPQQISRIRDFSDISVGFSKHVCAITDSKAIYCWGSGERGQLGVGSEVYLLEPTRVE